MLAGDPQPLSGDTGTAISATQLSGLGYVPPPYVIPTALMEDLAKLGPLFNAGGELHTLGQEIFEQHLAKQATDSNFKKVAYVIFGKGFKTFQAIWTLCLSGCGADGLALCASMFENVVDLAYIAKAPVKRSRRYVQYEQVGKYYQARKILGRKRLPRGKRKRYRGDERKLQPQIQNLLRHFPNRSLGWSQKTLKLRTEALGLGLEYDELYWIVCLHKHTLPSGVSGFVLSHQDGVDVIYGPNIKGVYPAAVNPARYFHRLCELVNDAYQLGLGARLAALSTTLGAAAHDVLQAHPELLA